MGNRPQDLYLGMMLAVGLYQEECCFQISQINLNEMHVTENITLAGVDGNFADIFQN